jgi:hypothetical protein
VSADRHRVTHASQPDRDGAQDESCDRKRPTGFTPIELDDRQNQSDDPDRERGEQSGPALMEIARSAPAIGGFGGG